MSKLEARAYSIYKMQKQRCGNPKHNSYGYYGARGIEVEYTPQEFIGWWIYQMSLQPNIKHPHCGRINHSHNYRFDNLELVERSANTREMNERLGHAAGRFVKVMAETSDGIRLYFDSIGECARVCGVKREVLVKHLTGQIESPISQLVFRYS